MKEHDTIETALSLSPLPPPNLRRAHRQSFLVPFVTNAYCTRCFTKPFPVGRLLPLHVQSCLTSYIVSLVCVIPLSFFHLSLSLQTLTQIVTQYARISQHTLTHVAHMHYRHTFAYTHTHTHTHTRARAHRHTHRDTHKHTLIVAYTHTRQI